MTDVPKETKIASVTDAAAAAASPEVLLVHEDEAELNDIAATTTAVISSSSAASLFKEANNNEDEPQQQQQQQLQQLVGEDEQQENDQKEDNVNSDKENDDDMDDEGLLKQGYDVILYGTSLVHAILASALARAGKKVLHVDVADYYGELDAVWTLPYLQELRRNEQEQQYQAQKDLVVDQQDVDAPIEEDYSTTNATINNSSTNSNSTILSLSSRGGLQGFQIHSMARSKDDDFHVIAKSKDCDNVVMTPYGKGRVIVGGTMSTTTNTTSLAISLTEWKLANGKYPTLYIGIPSSFVAQAAINAKNADTNQEQEMTQNDDDKLLLKKNRNQYLVHTAKIIPHQAITAREILDQRSRSIALDITPGLLYAHGPAVQGLLTSRVADNVEFKSLQGLWWYYNNNDNTTRTSTSANSGSAQQHRLEMVPCSKNDVFSSTLLTPMEKRRLMKFLQLALDYATAQEAAAIEQENATNSSNDNNDSNNSDLAIVQSLNERHLNQGRSLARPQNKAVNTSDMTTLQECIANEMDFDFYLQEKHALSLKLRSLVRYALALEVMDSNNNNGSSSNNSNNKPLSVEQGMKCLCRHMQALGRFGSTAFLIPMYGSGELSQAFCRSAAVYGATYILRRCIRGVVVVGSAANNQKGGDNDNKDDLSQQQQQQQQTTGVLISQAAGDEASSPSNTVPLASLREHLKQIPCQHVVIPESALLLQAQKEHNNETNQQQGGHHVKVPQRRVLRRISIVQGKPKVLLAKQSKDINNDSRQCRHAIIIPPGSLGGDQAYTIQGLVLDESVNVAPHVAPDGCCIVHLSTLVDVEGVTVDDDPTAGVTEAHALLLKRALDTIILANDDSRVQEIFHVSFSFPLYDDEGSNSNNARCKDEDRIKGLHVVRRPPPSLTVDPAFEQAWEIFDKICPGADFLTLSKDIETAVKERFGDACNPNDADDDEKLVLESAMGMIRGNDALSANAGPLFIWLGGQCPRAEEAEAGQSAKIRAHKLLLPVPSPSTPNVTVVGNQDQGMSEPTTSDQVLQLIQKHYSAQGASSDPRIYFASSSEVDDVMEHAILIKRSIVAVKKAGFSQFSYHVFTSGLVTPPIQTELVDLGIDCFHVSLFAGSKVEYEESTGRGAKVDGAGDEEEDFSKVRGFISYAVQQGVAVEASVLKRYEETGRVLARSLGAREIHVFDE